MKIKTILCTVTAVLALFATGCSGAYTGGKYKGTTTDYSGAEENVTTPVGNSIVARAKFASFIIGTGSQFDHGWDWVSMATIAKASETSTVNITIKSYSRLNEASIEKAVTFYTIEQNKKYSDGAPVRKDVLKSSVKECEVTGGGDSPASQNVTTNLVFTVDTSKVTDDTIAVLIDATILKDKIGNFVVNGDENDKVGEATDSLVRYITVSKKADDSDTNPFPQFYYGEDFSPDFPIKAYEKNNFAYDYANGKVTLTTKTAEWFDYSKAESVTAENLKDSLKSRFVIQTLAMGEKTWKDNELVFNYDSNNKNYTASVTGLTTGTRYRLIIRNAAKEKGPCETDSSTIKFGHPAYLSYWNKAYTTIDNNEMVKYFPEGQEIILTTTAFNAGTEYDSDYITTAQRSLLTAEKIADDTWKVTLVSPYEFAKADGFIVTDSNNVKVESETEKFSDNIVFVKIKTKASGTYKLWVGKETTIKVNAINSSQIAFGNFYQNVENVDAAGYVYLNSDITLINSSTGSSSKLYDYTLCYVDSMNSTKQDYYVNLQAGKTYTIEIMSGRKNDDVLAKAGYVASNNYYVYVYDPTDVSVTYMYGTPTSYNAVSQNFTAEYSGLYNIKIYPRNSGSGYTEYNGYVGFHIYQN